MLSMQKTKREGSNKKKKSPHYNIAVLGIWMWVFLADQNRPIPTFVSGHWWRLLNWKFIQALFWNAKTNITE